MLTEEHGGALTSRPYPKNSPDIETLTREEIIKSARLHVLRILQFGRGASNFSVVRSLLDATGHLLSREEIRDVAEWLEAAGYMKSKAVEDIQVYTLTERGYDAARGLIPDDGLLLDFIGR